MIGQPAVSSHIADLESALKLTLFERLPRGVRLTEAGELLLGYSRRLAALEEEAELAMTELRGMTRGRLRIGASTTAGAWLLPRLIGEFKRKFPGIEVMLDIGNTAEVHQRLVDGLLDFSVTEGFVEDPALVGEAVFQDQLVAIAPPSHPLIHMRHLKARMLNDTPMLLREPGSGTRAVVQRALEKKRIKPRHTMSIGSTEAIKQAVIAGLGVAIVSRMTIERELADGVLRIIPFADLSIDRPILLTMVKGRPQSSATQAFLPLLRKPVNGRR
jgi:DNA-binding transcriptional LysR family regulator